VSVTKPFFASRHSGGDRSDVDIWMATRERRFDDEGRRVPFGERVNLGRPVNTGMEDFSPMLTRGWPAAGATLYFGRRTPGLDRDI
jgi:hypothetical protein